MQQGTMEVPDYRFIVTQIFFIDDEVVCGEHKFPVGELFCRDMEGNWYIHAKIGQPRHYVHDAMVRLSNMYNPLQLHKDHWTLFASAKEEAQEHHLAVFRHGKVELMARRSY